ncbi:MAG: hypothetical protein M5R36_12970 [Deltaproteobacteria bacterium]|nr:hypothetical protein [Deltaproteobacteria bacterium]
MTKRRLVPCLLIATLMLSFPAFAEDDDDDDFFARETRTPADGGAYLTIGFQGMMLDTDRLTAKMAGTDPFRRVTGGLETELHFYGHGAGIFGVSSDFWAAETEGPDNGVDVTLRSWNILLDMGTDLVAGDAGAVSTVVGLGYGQNRMDIDGDFRAVDLSDPDLPSGRGKATLRQEGFVGDISLRADHRQSKYKGKKRRSFGFPASASDTASVFSPNGSAAATRSPTCRTSIKTCCTWRFISGRGLVLRARGGGIRRERRAVLTRRVIDVTIPPVRAPRGVTPLPKNLRTPRRAC